MIAEEAFNARGGRIPKQYSSYVGDVWEYGATAAAATASLGTACYGAKEPVLDAFGVSTLGNGAFGLDLTSAATSAATLFGVAGSSISAPIGGCEWYLGPPSIAIPNATTAGGFAHLAIPLPNDNALAGVTLTAQAFTMDGTAPIGVSFTAALQFTLGE